MEPFVRVKNVSKTIRGKQIIQAINFDLIPGQITGFIGPNGAGKTTTIRIMTGLMKPTSGEVEIGGISMQKNFSEAIRPVGVIVENPEMYSYLSGYKNLLHFARMHDKASKDELARIIDQVGLTDRIHEKVSTYSLGMRQRLGLAQALLHKPKFLILDEPTNGLDPAGIRELRVLLRKLADEEGVAVLVSSHLLTEIELMCDRIIIIQRGQIVETRDIRASQQSRYRFDIENEGLEILNSYNYTFTQLENFTIVDIERDQVPALIAQLVEKNIAIYAVTPYQESLEDQFLQVTGGDMHVPTHTK
ncbi:bacitracin ABC transporter ATP-binding protein [Kurthia sp. 3B1D]|uniref:Bacitracin ABC transporter ATP-binding protein n=2 Tax=Kurthia TaxID=1649 RepID=A0A433RWU4_9BACL|nr:ABC transporter ATP-binding protein [Kurthia sp. 3B1D]RUS57748.1 bacitracin ABC transporter ATP-binding protein [Kurthia sp. 3B1D]HIX43906.1 ABC transporter ATP-binding protein [Candidatus Kurthia intestinigallinarum]